MGLRCFWCAVRCSDKADGSFDSSEELRRQIGIEKHDSLTRRTRESQFNTGKYYELFRGWIQCSISALLPSSSIRYEPPQQQIVVISYRDGIDADSPTVGHHRQREGLPPRYGIKKRSSRLAVRRASPIHIPKAV